MWARPPGDVTAGIENGIFPSCLKSFTCVVPDEYPDPSQLSARKAPRRPESAPVGQPVTLPGSQRQASRPQSGCFSYAVQPTGSSSRPFSKPGAFAWRQGQGRILRRPQTATGGSTSGTARLSREQAKEVAVSAEATPRSRGDSKQSGGGSRQSSPRNHRRFDKTPRTQEPSHPPVALPERCALAISVLARSEQERVEAPGLKDKLKGKMHTMDRSQNLPSRRSKQQSIAKRTVSIANVATQVWKRQASAMEKYKAADLDLCFALVKNNGLPTSAVRSIHQEVQRLREDFVDGDTDGSELLEMREFENIIVARCGLEDQAELPEHLLSNSFKTADADGDGKVSFEEYVSWCITHSHCEEWLVPNKHERNARQLARERNVSLDEVEELKKVFDGIDSDRSGEIEKEEFRLAVGRLLGVEGTLPDHSFLKHWNEIDADHGGTVSFNEFLDWYFAHFCRGQQGGCIGRRLNRRMTGWHQ